MPQQSFSFFQQTWKRLKKNKGALFGLIVISMAVFITLFGYLLAPDGSPNADLQTVEIQARKPGYKQLFLKIPDKKNSPVHLFTRLIKKFKNHILIASRKSFPFASKKRYFFSTALFFT